MSNWMGPFSINWRRENHHQQQKQNIIVNMRRVMRQRQSSAPNSLVAEWQQHIKEAAAGGHWSVCWMLAASVFSHRPRRNKWRATFMFWHFYESEKGDKKITYEMSKHIVNLFKMKTHQKKRFRMNFHKNVFLIKTDIIIYMCPQIVFSVSNRVTAIMARWLLNFGHASFGHWKKLTFIASFCGLCVIKMRRHNIRRVRFIVCF